MKELESMLQDHATEVGHVPVKPGPLVLARLRIKADPSKSAVFQEEVIKAVESVCTYLPSTLADQCKDLIDTYGQAIIELLVQQADPKTVCTFLALCNDASRAYVGELYRKQVMAGTRAEELCDYPPVPAKV